MERKEGLKMEDVLGNSSFSDYIPTSFPLQSVFDFSYGETMPLGFMELLGVQDLSPSSFDMAEQAPSLNNPCSTKIESPAEVLNQPTTPNSPSVSSASSEAVNDEPVKVDDQEEDQQKTKKQLKPKKTNQKRQREPRFAFMTKSEVDHLEDGYRWRKYGQKAVKNSSFPRSYYRCTTTSCNVKKRVERSFSDPSIVITTYEGQHTHPSPIMPRSCLAAGAHLSSGISAAGAVASGFGMAVQRSPSHYQQPFVNTSSPFNFGQNGSSLNPGFLHERRFCSPGPSLLKDHGLLQDIVPSHMLKEE
ncbi:WRKY DNA-BINDING PROTEIN 23, WRKY DNA-binding protein 23 [Hibiscus trionum]|uniref:WRKY transcription factor n=1 Tax=Hibiscus trionum TaxID=183268 RepID=A0A9W7HYL9_HIBTR|nr:WRKY DNA-BINDING PROTEIN 23, WRKY DNA-binding protein 23 [Hibiscus trionum]